MKRTLFAACLLVLAAPVFAADPPPKPDAAPSKPVVMLPVILTSDEMTALQTYLNSQPYSFSSPLINLFTVKEQQAQAAAAAAASPAPAKK